MSINLHPCFKSFFNFLNVNLVCEEMVWQTVPVFDISHKKEYLKELTLANLVGILYKQRKRSRVFRFRVWKNIK